MREAGSSNRTALAFLLLGSLGGALGSGAVGLWLGRHARPALPPPSPPAVAAPLVPPKLLSPKEGPDAGAVHPDGGAAEAPVVVCVEVRDSGDRPVAAALVSARPMPTVSSGLPNKGVADPGVGELGVYPGPLPFPEDIVSGQYAPLGRVGSSGAAAAAAAAAGPNTPKTDDKGRVCLHLGPPSHIQITAVREERSASVELWLPSANKSAPADAAGAALTVVLRLSESLDALCRLMTPAPLPAGSDEPGEAVSDTLGPDVTGRVVDGRGFGLAAVRVEGQVGRSRTVGVTDSSGSFKLSGLPGGSLSLRAQLGGYAATSLSRRADEPRTELQLTLRPGGGISGTLRDGRRGGLPSGAQLTLTASDGSSQSVSLSSDGSFSTTGLPVGPATLRARAPGYGSLSRSINIPASDSPSQVSLRDLRLELEAGAGLVGQVRGPTGAAASVTILVQDESGATVGKTLTDEHGDFHLADLPPGRVRITASAANQGRAETTTELRSGGEERTYLELR